jgi:hypothetical protein
VDCCSRNRRGRHGDKGPFRLLRSSMPLTLPESKFFPKLTVVRAAFAASGYLHSSCLSDRQSDAHLADEIALAFARLGVRLVGPVQSLTRAMELLDSCGHLDGAVLDINMRAEMVFPLADALRKRGVPFTAVPEADRSHEPRAGSFPEQR